jgi:riboflavin kinase/FMN adenylyltransferase
VRFFRNSKLENLNIGSSSNIALVVGNFDGFHLGHQALLNEIDLSTKAGLQYQKVILSFYPHPRAAIVKIRNLKQDKISPLKIFSLRDRLRLASDYKVDIYYALRFDRTLASLTPEEFIERYVVHLFKAKLVVVGEDWRFGVNRSGDTQLLKKLGKKFGFSVSLVKEFNINDTRVSSTRVRQAISEGNLEKISALLGRSYSLCGVVKHGANRGAALNAKTANIYPKSEILPPYGVYFTKVHCEKYAYDAITNVGINPTFCGTRPKIESHLLTPGDIKLYGKVISVDFLKFLRPEIKFTSSKELKDQIELDIKQAKTFFDS